MVLPTMALPEVPPGSSAASNSGILDDPGMISEAKPEGLHANVHFSSGKTLFVVQRFS